MSPVTRKDLQTAREVVAPRVHHTPLLTSRLLSEETDCTVRLNAESFHRTGSYKVRGALNKPGSLTTKEGKWGVVCSSAGNHAQGVALAGALFGIRTVPPKGSTVVRVLNGGNVDLTQLQGLRWN